MRFGFRLNAGVIRRGGDMKNKKYKNKIYSLCGDLSTNGEPDLAYKIRMLIDNPKAMNDSTEYCYNEIKDKTEKMFETELIELINKHSKENASNTPDFILAMYMKGCLKIFNTAIQQRETWYGRDSRSNETKAV